MTAPRPEAERITDEVIGLCDAHVTPGDGEVRAENVRPYVLEIIDAALTAARADERERAAKVCEERAARYFGQGRGIARKLAAAIRAMEGR